MADGKASILSAASLLFENGLFQQLTSHCASYTCGFCLENYHRDQFPSATVLFMDIAGFTAWSSAREPSQVFLLLETIYRCFDKIAKTRRVFKVETIGDCYGKRRSTRGVVVLIREPRERKESSKIFSLNLLSVSLILCDPQSCLGHTVAVCGLPEPNDDHAIVMAKFARDCLSKMDELTRKLRVRLGKSLDCIFGWN